MKLTKFFFIGTLAYVYVFVWGIFHPHLVWKQVKKEWKK